MGVTLGELEKLFFLNTIHPFFEEHHLIPLVFIAKLFFSFMVPRHRSWGVPLGELEQFYEGFDGNLVDFSGVKSLKTVHLCPFMLQYR